MTEEKQIQSTKKSRWENLSPKLMFIFGLTTGITVFFVLNFLYLFISLTKTTSLPKKVTVVNNQEEVVTPPSPEVKEPSGTPVGTFIDTGKEICKKDGKPIIRLFATSWCPHCNWIKETFDKVANDYVKKRKIVAYHWELDTGDDLLTEEKEKAVPPEEERVFNEFNPHNSIPTFVFGCRYYRIGNGYEREGEPGKVKEEKEFRDLIEKILKES